MKKIFKKNMQSGFTLIETLVTIFIFVLLMLGTTLLLTNVFSFSKQQYGVLTNEDQAVLISNTFVNEIRNVANGANGAYPLGEASNSEIIFYSSAPKNDGTISKVRYSIDSNGKTLTKGVTNPAGNPLSYSGQTEKVTTLSTKMALGTTPILFTYYDGNYTGSGNALSQPVNINVTKFVKINLTILKELTPNSSNTFSVTAGANLRNLKTNLGN